MFEACGARYVSSAQARFVRGGTVSERSDTRVAGTMAKREKRSGAGDGRPASERCQMAKINTSGVFGVRGAATRSRYRTEITRSRHGRTPRGLEMP